MPESVEDAERAILEAEAEMVAAAQELEAAEHNLARKYSQVEAAKRHAAYCRRLAGLPEPSERPDPI